MAQVSSNTLAYNQIFFKIKSFVASNLQNKFESLEDKVTAYNELLQDIYNTLGQPLTKFEPLIKGEPPISEKINRYSSSFSDDLNIVAKQIDFINAKTVNIFNLFTNELESEKTYIERVASKVKILQMYSKSPANDLVYLGDSFDNMDMIDVTKIKQRYMPLIGAGQFTLPISSSRPIRAKQITTIRDKGFLGNNHQVIKQVSSDGTSTYKYVFEDTPNLAAVETINDSNPLTFMEIELLNVDKSSAPVSISESEFSLVKTTVSQDGKTSQELVNWSDDNITDPLQTTFAMDFASNKANSIEIVPYFRASKLLKITQITLFKKTIDSTNTTTIDILKAPIYIGSSLAPINLESSKNYFYNKAIIRFPETEVFRVEISCQQDGYEDIEIGHIYWKPNYPENTSEDSPFVSMERFNPDSLSQEIYSEIIYDRFELLPPSTNPNLYKRTQGITKTIDVTVKTRPQTYNFWVIKFSSTRMIAGEATPNEPTVYTPGLKTDGYFKQWVNGIDNPEEGFQFVESVTYREGRLLNVSYWANKEDGQEDLDTFKALVESNPNSFVSINDAVYKIENIKLVKVTKEETGFSYTYKVPVISSREIYPAKRKAIGIRDISLAYETYAGQAEVVSKPFRYDKNVEALMLSVESDLFEASSSDVVVKYYISVDGIKSWIEVSPIQLDSSGPAEVLVFNSKIPQSAQLPGVMYLNAPDVPESIKEAIVRIEVIKSRLNNFTPVFYSYQLVAKVES